MSGSPGFPTALPLDEIFVGTRHRRDMGDIAGLAASMSKVGLLQAVGVTPAGTLIWGERRLRAAKLPGWADIAANVVDLDDITRGEYAENVHRKDFTLSEAVAIKRALEPIEREAAKERMHAGKPLEKFSEGNGRALDKVAAVVGKHRTTIAKAEAIVDVAEAEPEIGKLLEAMDKAGRVNAPYKRLRVAKQPKPRKAAKTARSCTRDPP